MTNMKPDQQVCPQQRCAADSTSEQGFCHLRSPPLEVEQEVPTEGEQVASKVLDGNDGMEVFHSCGYSQQVQGSVPSQADQLNRHEDAGQHGGEACDYELEEGEIYDAEDGNLLGSEKFVEENGVDGALSTQASPPTTPTTPGSILI